MSEHDFAPLYAIYPSIIAEMPERFTSHQFILELARQHQTLYIEALHSYRHQEKNGKPVPFMIVHGVLAQRLNEYPGLIKQIRKDAPSKNIFSQDDVCSEWQKLG